MSRSLANSTTVARAKGGGGGIDPCCLEYWSDGLEFRRTTNSSARLEVTSKNKLALQRECE